MKFRATDIANAVDGDLTGDDVEVDGVAIDSRLIIGGELFVPVIAERDGHEFVAQAVDAGAVAYLCSRDVDVDGTHIKVDDTADALLQLGRHARTRLADNAAVIGITGSVGKTTVKDLTKAVLATRFRTHASPRSFNNELGVPLTLTTAPDDVDAVVVEMGARGRGHIELLCGIARPNIAVVTTVALAHAEMFGTIEDVAVAKGELIESLPPSGTAVLNADNPYVLDMAGRSRAEVVTFGLEHPVDVTATRITYDDELRPSFTLRSPWGQVDLTLAVRGAHQVMNALAAAAAAMAAGVTPDDVAQGLAHATLSPWRMDLQRTSSGALVLNDAYNANPTSVEAALRSLAALPATRRFAVLGVMAELGPHGPTLHRDVAAVARELGITVIAVDAPDYGVATVSGVGGALTELGPLGEGDAVLVKGSRVAGLEQLAEKLLAIPAT